MNPTTTTNTGDAERAAFLQALDDADVQMTDWEYQFVTDLLTASNFTEPQRAKIDQLRRKYRSEI